MTFNDNVSIFEITLLEEQSKSLPACIQSFGALIAISIQPLTDGRIAFVSENVERIVGRSVGSLLGSPWTAFMAAEDIAKVAVLMAALPPEVNLYEATILPNHARSFIGRG